MVAVKRKTIVIGLGNELFGDDAVGILAVRRLARIAVDKADFLETGLHGVALLDLLMGYKKAIILDAITTGRNVPGTVLKIEPKDLKAVESPSPHFTGIPDLINLAKRLGLDFPQEIIILAMEVSNTCHMTQELTKPVADSMGAMISKAMECLKD